MPHESTRGLWLRNQSTYRSACWAGIYSHLILKGRRSSIYKPKSLRVLSWLNSASLRLSIGDNSRLKIWILDGSFEFRKWEIFFLGQTRLRRRQGVFRLYQSKLSTARMLHLPLATSSGYFQGNWKSFVSEGPSFWRPFRTSSDLRLWLQSMKVTRVWAWRVPLRWRVFRRAWWRARLFLRL